MPNATAAVSDLIIRLMRIVPIARVPIARVPVARASIARVCIRAIAGLCSLVVSNAGLTIASFVAAGTFQPTVQADAEPEIIIQRGIQVVVFPERVHVAYEIGLSTDSARAWLGRRIDSNKVPEDERELIERFRDLVVPEIVERLRILLESERLDLELEKTRLFPKHYVQLECVFDALIQPKHGPLELSIRDGSFRGLRGQMLLALKGEDGVVVESSTVPLILARVPRQTVGTTTAAQMEASRRAQAVVRLPIEESQQRHTNTAPQNKDGLESNAADAVDEQKQPIAPIVVVIGAVGLLLIVVLRIRMTR